MTGVAGLFAACDKDETKDPTNYIQIGKKKTEIAMGAMFIQPEQGSDSKFKVMLLGKGLDISTGFPMGDGNLASVETPETPGEYSVDGDNTTGAYSKDVHLVGSSGSDGGEMGEMGMLADGSKVKWSKTGKVYTIDFEGNTTLADGTAGEFLKVHYVGELLSTPADE